MADMNEDISLSTDIIEDQQNCQTCNAKWLCINNIYNHFQRPNFYDIGGTYTLEEAADFWFLYKTERVTNLYILHLFVINRRCGSFKLSVCNSNEMNVNERTNTIHFNYFSKVFIFKNVPESGCKYVTTYSFTEFDIELMKDKKLMIAIKINSKPTNDLLISTDHITSQYDYGQLITDPVCSDFFIVSGRGTKMPVHKFLLTARSAVFRAMLKEDTAESLSNSVTIDDVSEEDLRDLIEFIYTGTVKNFQNSNWFILLMLGDRYDLKGLKELAEHTLVQTLNNSNVLEILLIADLYNSTTLKFSAFKYIKTNITTIDSSIFNGINNIQLARELCRYLAMKF